MSERRQRPEHAGVSDKNIELAPAFEDCGAKPVERFEILEVARHEGRFASFTPNRIVEFLKRALGACERDHMGARAGEFQSHRAPDAARGARHKGNTAFKRERHEIYSSIARA